MIYFVTITSQGQMTIPAVVRRELGLEKNHKAKLVVKNKEIILSPTSDIDALWGILKTKKRISLQKEREAREGAWLERTL